MSDKQNNNPIYQHLYAGDKLEKGDEYSTTDGLWKEIPDCLIGDKIPESQSETQWRRLIKKEKGTGGKKHWYSF